MKLNVYCLFLASLFAGWIIIDSDHALPYLVFHSMYLVYFVGGIAVGLLTKYLLRMNA